MSHVNVVVTAVDNGMDIMKGYEEELHNLQILVNSDIAATIEKVEYEKVQAEMAIYGLDPDAEYAGDDLETLCWQKEMFETLLYQTTVKGEELENEFRLISERSKNLIDESIRIMGEYIRKLNLSVLSTSQGTNTGSNGAPGYYVVIVDSAKYPQTADHIKKAQEMGFPEFVSLDRSHAADRRSISLAHVKANPEKDRDEWPMAVFREGGAGAHIRYVDASDNRGAGSAIGWQMRNFPDGSRIRVRVI